MFSRVLVANRGEIAVRIIRTLRTLGIRSVLAASVPDRHGLAARSADEVVLLEGSRADETYLNVERVIEAARSSGCDAIHPGYGFLSESPLLAEACAAAELTFIGPPSDVLRALGDKSTARELAVQSGIPVVPGWDGEGADDEFSGAAARIGYPLMVKARGGGGGRGMRRVNTEIELAEAVESAKREAAAAFGDDRVFIERYVTDAHHVEVQVLADQHGAIVHLGERDCSVQRRHQKLIEETPSPVVDDALRERLTEAALKLMRAAGYVNAGTVEFLVGPEAGGTRPFFFMEVNPRLQVEHTVTEEVTGLDIVELQLRIAAGEPLPFTQDEVEFNGHAMEFRINAEDPFDDFRPSSGRITDSWFVGTHGPRFDFGFQDGDSISPQYDSLLGKLIVHADTRPEAINRARGELDPRSVDGILTNIGLHAAISQAEAFVRGSPSITWLEDELEGLLDELRSDTERWVAAAASLVFCQGIQPGMWIGAGETSVFLTDGRETQHVTLLTTDRKSGTATCSGAVMKFRMNDKEEALVGEPGRMFRHAHNYLDGIGPAIYDERGGVHYSVAAPPPLPRRATTVAAGARVVTAPLAGTVGLISVEVGQAVEAGDLLLVLEAMKMEHRVTAPSGGVVRELHVQTGQVVTEADELAVLGEPPV